MQRVDPAQRVVAGFVFVSRAMRELYDHIEAAADSDASVLLTGETGTGKSHVAKAIHDLSPRRKKPFVVVECGGLSPTLLESELFGHVRGAFTGADREHVGKFATVEDGTILLDEIDCVPLEAQAKLLRVFEDRVYEPVGANRTAKFRARVIAATNQPLDRLVAEGKFRSDLFFRLNVVEFRLPPLRDCREAIGPLAENFLTIYCQRTQRSMDGIYVCGPRRHAGLRLAGQHPRVAQHHRAGRDPVPPRGPGCGRPARADPPGRRPGRAERPRGRPRPRAERTGFCPPARRTAADPASLDTARQQPHPRPPRNWASAASRSTRSSTNSGSSKRRREPLRRAPRVAQSIAFQFAVQRRTVDAQDAGGLAFHPVRHPQRLQDVMPLQFIERRWQRRETACGPPREPPAHATGRI